MKKDIRIAVLGLGWMGQAHSRSALRIPSLFPDRGFQPILQVCADVDPAHHWIRDSWNDQVQDPRCPVTSAQGKVKK